METDDLLQNPGIVGMAVRASLSCGFCISTGQAAKITKPRMRLP
jgi:hypothetical protein